MDMTGWDVWKAGDPVKHHLGCLVETLPRQTCGRTRTPSLRRALLKRALTMGIDPGGNELDLSMPRYRMPHKAAEALVAYLKTLGSEPAPGVDDTRVRLGVILPPAGP